MAYIGADPDGQGKAQRFTFTASGGETVVSADDDGIPIGYTAGQVSVYLNGVKLVVGTGKDCQATNGSTITGLAALAASDVVEIVALSTFDATTVEGTALISTGETGGTKFLREDGDGTSSWQTVTEYNDDVIQTNIAMLGFKVAVNGSLAKYDLQDQIIDEYTTNAGVNEGDSVNYSLSSGAYQGRGSAATGGTITESGDTFIHTFLRAQTGDDWVSTETVSANYIIVGGGGSGGGRAAGGSYHGASGGGGAGGMLVGTSVSISAGTYEVTVGAKGAGASGLEGASGGDSSFNSQTATGGGHGAVGTVVVQAANGGSGGGATRSESGGDNGETPGTGVSGQGNAGGSINGTWGGGSGGGGKGSAGVQGGNYSGHGGDGLVSAISGADVTYAGGGGGGEGGGGTPPGAGNGGSSIGGAGGENDNSNGSNAVVNTGSGGGGGGAGVDSSTSNSGGDGSDGIVIISYSGVFADMTLQSSDTTAEAAPTKADMVMLVEDAGSGVGTVNTHIKGWVSRYETGGEKTWTQGTLVDEGDWGSDKRILAFHDLTLTGTSGTQMAYKITTHSASAVYNTKVHATSIGWR